MTIIVQFGFAEAGQEVNFYDISPDVISVNVTRGKDPQQDTFNAASCSIQLNNERRQYDPDYGASPYQGLIVPTGEVKVYKENQIVFTGVITDWNFSYSPTGESVAEIVASDAFWNLNNQTLAEFSPIEQLSSARILSVLLKPEVGGTAIWTPERRVISTGVATMGSYDVADGTNALSYLQSIEKSEPGRLFIDKEGRLVFRSRNNDVNNPTFEYTRINLCYNPSFENNTTGWVSTAGTITRSTAQSYIGTASGLLSAEGVVEQTFTTEPGLDYSMSVYTRANSGTAIVSVTAISSTSGTAYDVVDTFNVDVFDDGWQRWVISLNATSVFSGFRISELSGNTSVFIDGVLIEASPAIDAYFDGSNPPVYNSTNPAAPDYEPQRAFESYETEWILE
jgi:hypothetical protein